MSISPLFTADILLVASLGVNTVHLHPRVELYLEGGHLPVEADAERDDVGGPIGGEIIESDFMDGIEEPLAVLVDEVPREELDKVGVFGVQKTSVCLAR